MHDLDMTADTEVHTYRTENLDYLSPVSNAVQCRYMSGLDAPSIGFICVLGQQWNIYEVFI